MDDFSCATFALYCGLSLFVFGCIVWLYGLGCQAEI